MNNDGPVMTWRPIPVDYFLNIKQPFRFKTLGLLLLWVLIIAGSMWFSIINLPSNWAAAQDGNQQLLQLFIFNPPMLVGLIMLFWLGFDWAFIPVFLSMFVIGIFSGLQFMWAILFGLSFVFGISIYAITYQSVSIRYDLRSVMSFLIFVMASFIAATASSLGAFIWTFSNNLSSQATEILWNGWWAGTFFQSVIIVGPILFIFSRKIEQLKDRDDELPVRRKVSIAWVYSAIVVVVAVISVFIYSSQYLGKNQIAEEISRVGQISEDTILSSLNSFSTITWLSIWVIICVGAILFLSNWNYQLKAKVEEKTESLREANQAVEESLSEKIILLKEIHHRVKNNLAVITALLEMQYMRSAEENIKQALSNAITRVKSMAFVHETLYSSENFANVDLKSYIERLCDSVESVFSTNEKDIKMEVNTTGSYKVDMEKAIPLGLLLNELLVNAYRHAFEGRDKGVISVDLHSDDEILVLTVSDDGIGYSYDEVAKKGKTNLGITIINTLVNQLRAKKEITSKPGHTQYRFTVSLSGAAGV